MYSNIYKTFTYFILLKLHFPDHPVSHNRPQPRETGHTHVTEIYITATAQLLQTVAISEAK
jgi:hypothetical protein